MPHYTRLLLTIITALTVISTSSAADHALVKIAAANMRSKPSHASELVSQAVLGTPVTLLQSLDGWYLTETPDGYQGYIAANSLHPVDSLQFAAWKKSHRVMFTAPYTSRVISRHGPVSDIHAGSILQVTGKAGIDSVKVRLPDGRHGTLPVGMVTPLDRLTASKIDTSSLIAMARALMGTSYLWGGTTTAAMDCSGLSKICYLNQGIILRRDASQQFATGQQLGTDFHDYRRGDLVFFKSATTGNIVHVGIYDHDGLYIHCAGRVRVNSLDQNSPLYIRSNILAGAIRVIPGSQGQTTVTRHNLYFPVQARE